MMILTNAVFTEVNFNLCYEAIKLARSAVSGPGPSAFEASQTPPFIALFLNDLQRGFSF